MFKDAQNFAVITLNFKIPAEGLANSAEPGQTAPLEPYQSDLGLHCFALA